MTEPRNPFYLLMLVVGLLFVSTALAVAVLPVIEDKALQAGEVPPPSPFRDSVRRDGWKWILAEAGVLIVLAVASMVYDDRRTLKSAEPPRTIPPNDPNQPPIT